MALYDSQSSAGGWLRNGIPPFRLAPDALDADIADIASIGIKWKWAFKSAKIYHSTKFARNITPSCSQSAPATHAYSLAKEPTCPVSKTALSF